MVEGASSVSESSELTSSTETGIRNRSSLNAEVKALRSKNEELKIENKSLREEVQNLIAEKITLQTELSRARFDAFG